MDSTLILIDNDAELTRAHELVDALWDSNDPLDLARLQAQATASVADLIRLLMDHYGLTRADMAPILGHQAESAKFSTVRRG
jgi:antitoxin component HigA of HigAB toxin-antitoxin module